MTDSVPTPWEEPRGPHLPDALVRVPRSVWPFVVLGALAGLGEWSRRTVGRPLELSIAVAAVVSVASTASIALWGAAFFWRHHDGQRAARSIALGVVVAAIYVVADLLRGWAFYVVTTLASPDLDVTTFVLAASLLGAVITTILLISLVLIARGLRQTRAAADDPKSRGLAIVLTLIAVTGGVLALTSTIRFYSSNAFNVLVLAVGVVVIVATMLAWAYLAVVASSGWRGDARPSTGWVLAALAGGLTVAAGSILYALQWLVITGVAPASGFPPGYELVQSMSQLGPILLFVAFAVGLPSLGEVDPVDASAGAGATTAGS